MAGKKFSYRLLFMFEKFERLGGTLTFSVFVPSCDKHLSSSKICRRGRVRLAGSKTCIREVWMAWNIAIKWERNIDSVSVRFRTENFQSNNYNETANENRYQSLTCAELNINIETSCSNIARQLSFKL